MNGMMNINGLKLLISDKPDIERDALAAAWQSAGGEVVRLGRFWDPPDIEPSQVRVYGSDNFCLILQQKLGLDLCSPPDDLLLSVPNEYLRRKVDKLRLKDASTIKFPKFLKSATPKLFPSKVYQDLDELKTNVKGLEVETQLIASAPVYFDVEARVFLLNGAVLDCAIYEGASQVKDAASFAEEVVRHVRLPETVVMDIGHVQGEGWAVIEFNASWGAGLNGCDPALVWPCIASASGISTK